MIYHYFIYFNSASFKTLWTSLWRSVCGNSWRNYFGDGEGKGYSVICKLFE